MVEIEKLCEDYTKCIDNLASAMFASEVKLWKQAASNRRIMLEDRFSQIHYDASLKINEVKYIRNLIIKTLKYNPNTKLKEPRSFIDYFKSIRKW